jgi:predicted Zn-dependent protease
MRLNWCLHLTVSVLFVGVQAHAQFLSKPSPKQQVQLGQRAASELRRKQHVLPSADWRVQELRAVGSRLLSTVNLSGKPWQFTFDVVDSKEINAFALPGGPVFFYTGLFDKLTSEDELAGVLGHEMTHVLRQHWAQAYADSQKRDLFLGLALIFTHANSTLTNLASIGNTVVFDLPFSRKDETQADEGGLNTMVRAGYNPQGMVDVFTMLGQQSRSSVPAFLRDHPTDASRIRHMHDVISGMHRSFPPMIPLHRSY